MLGLGSSNTENYNNSDFYILHTKEWTETYILYQSYYINQSPKAAPNMQRITQLLHGMQKLDTIINIKSNFRR